MRWGASSAGSSQRGRGDREQREGAGGGGHQQGRIRDRVRVKTDIGSNEMEVSEIRKRVFWGRER